MKKTCTHVLLYLFLAVCLPSLGFSEEAAAIAEIPNEAAIPLLCQNLKDRKILKIKLSNGMQGYLVSDPGLEKSGALVSVRAGSFDDPDGHPGLAHFLEHMLFLGTKKYPKESEFQKFISENGGMTNAFTSDTYTSFLFSINNEKINEGVDRFASFFKEPLFNCSGVARELCAIDQEYAKNLEHDSWRTVSVLKELANPSHPYHRFSIGNSKTLKNASQEVLKKWYQEHYSADLMTFAIYSTLPMEEVKTLAFDAFKDVPKNPCLPTDAAGPIFPKSLHGKMIHIDPVKNSRLLTVAFELPKEFTGKLDSRPESIAAYVLGHEGEMSLLQTLKQEGLATGLSAGASKFSSEASLLFLEVDLSEKGLQDTQKVIYRIFQTISRFQENPVPFYIFDEMQKIAKLHYQYQMPQDTFSDLMVHARLINDESLATYPEHSCIIQNFDPELVQNLFKALTPHRAIFMLTASEKDAKTSFDRLEKWFHTKYKLSEMPKDFLARLENVSAHASIDFPPPNPFIPKNFDIIAFNDSEETPLEENKGIPAAVLDSALGTIYFLKDTRFKTPKIHWHFNIKLPGIEQGNAKSIVLADFYVKNLSEKLTPFAYPAETGGLNYSIDVSYFGLSIGIEGYSENANVLFEKILSEMKTAAPSREEFDLYKKSLLDDYQNASKESPLAQGFETLKSVLYKKFTTNKQKALQIKKISYEDFLDYQSKLFDQIHVEGMLTGNLNRQDAEKAVEKLFDTLGKTPYLDGKGKKPLVATFPKEQGPFYYEQKVKALGHAAILAIECCEGAALPEDFKALAAGEILMQGIEQDFFATLRTKQQTGYIVHSFSKDLQNRLFAVFSVQSNTHHGQELLARFETFLEGFLQELEHSHITEDRFETLREVIISKLSTPPENLSEMASRLKLLAFEKKDFDWINKRVAGLKELSYQEFAGYAKQFLGRKNKQRVALLASGKLPDDRTFQYAPVGRLDDLKKLNIYSQ